MNIKITCSFTIKNSHEIQEIGFRGDNKIDLVMPINLNDFNGVVGTQVIITKSTGVCHAICPIH